MVAFNDHNFLVASIPIHRGEIHLKKYVLKCLVINSYLIYSVGFCHKDTESE